MVGVESFDDNGGNFLKNRCMHVSLGQQQQQQ